MTKDDIEKTEKLAAEIQNFRDCYSNAGELWGTRDGPVMMATLLEWLIENPHMNEIAQDINKLKG